MVDIRAVTGSFAVAPQLTADDLGLIAEQGFKTVICNRPDDEEVGQPGITEMKTKAEALGLTFLALPFAGAPSLQIADQQGDLVENAQEPILAYCRSGTRSITAWALSQRGAGKRDEILEAAANAGYDLCGLASAL